MKAMIVFVLGILVLAMCSCRQNRKQEEAMREKKIEKALSNLQLAAYERGLKKHSASKPDALPNEVAEYQEALAEFSRAKSKCEELGLDYSQISEAQKRGDIPAQDVHERMKTIISDY